MSKKTFSVEYKEVRHGKEHVAIIRDSSGEIVETITASDRQTLERFVEDILKRKNM